MSFIKRYKKDSWQKTALMLKQGAVGVIPTDTIYGIVGLALNKDVVEKIYKLKKRLQEKPMVILISSQDDLKMFGVKINFKQKKILEKFWPGKVSIILNCLLKKFSYLHKNTNSLAFRLPAKKEILKILSITGPLVASSANQEGCLPATTIAQAKKYFGNKVFYFNKGKINSKPSTLIKLTKNKFEISRFGATKIVN
ncbi:MAG: L-threonylcarbamoyladenylate synthase [Patescibacteria group bacterium]